MRFPFRELFDEHCEPRLRKLPGVYAIYVLLNLVYLPIVGRVSIAVERTVEKKSMVQVKFFWLGFALLFW